MSYGMNKKRRKIRKRRVLRVKPLLFLVILVVSVCFLMGAAIGNNAKPEPQGKEFVSVTVKQGDTIWGLIKEARPDYSGNMQKAVYEVRQVNGLSGNMIYPGQILEIPVN